MNLAPIDPLGFGASADVWLADDLDLKRRVAVKYFNETEPSVHRKLALDHARALARVQHPNVVGVLGLEPQSHPESGQECLAIVMEYVDGTPLSRLSESLTHERSLATLRDIAAGLDAIHESGMVHGDLHEGNVVITSHGAKLLDILYTQSLAEVGSRTATSEKGRDIRDCVKVMRSILEKTQGIEASRVATAHYLAEKASSAGQAVEILWGELLPGTPSHGASNKLTNQSARDATNVHLHGVYLVLARQPTSSLPRTLAYVSKNDDEFTTLGELPNFYHATSTRLWELRPGKRMFRILNDEVLEKWQTGEPQSSSDYRLNGISDALLASLGDDIVLAVGASTPEPFTTHDYFAYERELRLVGALGPYVFFEQHDYTFGGGAHGGVDSTFRLFDLDEMRMFESPSALFDEKELPLLAKHRDIARSFVLLRSGDLVEGDDTEVTLVSAVPYVDSDSFGEFGVRLTYSAPATYAASDGRWASYTISEELKFRGTLTSLARYARPPQGLRAILGELQPNIEGWSYLPPDHPCFSALLERLRMQPEVAPVSVSVLPQHNRAAPWRAVGHGLADEDLALAVSDEVARTSASRDEALLRLPTQLRYEFGRSGRQPSEQQLGHLVELANDAVHTLFKELEASVANEHVPTAPSQPPTVIAERRDGVTIVMQCSRLFPSGKTELLPLGAQELDRVAEFLKQQPSYESISVEGHTDSIGTGDTNLRLSQDRADSVGRHLVNAGLPADLIRTFGKGKSVPVADNSTPEGRALNRRIEILVQRL